MLIIFHSKTYKIQRQSYRKLLPVPFLISLILFCTFPRHLQAGFKNNTLTSDVCIGPQVYHLKRVRTGGTKQEGWLYGGILTLERLKKQSIYLGVNGYWSKGKLKGHTGSGAISDSWLTDRQIEGRVGFAFQIEKKKLFFVPYGGAGYLKETTKKIPPSLSLVRTTDTIRYLSTGFLSGISFSRCFRMGLNFEAKFMLKGQSKINDPDAEEDESPPTLEMGNEPQYRVEVPFWYKGTRWPQCLELNLTPFFEKRHYGEHQGYPYDYVETKMYATGAQLQLSFNF